MVHPLHEVRQPAGVALGGDDPQLRVTLEDAPEQVNENCYGDGWILTVRPTDASAVDELMDAESYRKYLADRQD